MNTSVTAVTCYKAGTADVLSVWLRSVYRHSEGSMPKVVVLAKRGDVDADAKGILDAYSVAAEEVDVGSDPVSVSRVHGMMLDAFVPGKVETEYVLTMDTDCFPVAEGWLSGLVGMMEGGARVAGILHPWAPPPFDMKRSRLEWRVRSQHCWENTHVACQMTRTADLSAMGVRFAGGDDTGLLVPKAARDRGWKVDGYMVTRCPKARNAGFDSEFNRYVGLVFGDKMFHCGGFTRLAMGDKPVFEDEYGWVRAKVLESKGAEFLLDDEWSYRFGFDKEEAVAKEKMDRLFGMREGLK